MWIWTFLRSTLNDGAGWDGISCVVCSVVVVVVCEFVWWHTSSLFSFV